MISAIKLRFSEASNSCDIYKVFIASDARKMGLDTLKRIRV